MSEAAEFRLDEIGQIAITAHDLDRATAFYRDVLGLRHLFSAPPQMSFFDCGGIRLLIGVPESKELDHPASVLYYRVDDIQLAFRTLRDRGATVEGEPHAVHRSDRSELWLAFLRDSEGNLLGLMSELPLA